MTFEDGPETRGGEGLSVMVLNSVGGLRLARSRRDLDFEALQENHEHFGIPLRPSRARGWSLHDSFHEGFDPGSELTLAAWLRQASRTSKPARVSKWRKGE